MESTLLQELCSKILDGPAVLLLGQDVLRQCAGEDLFLAACAARFGLPGVRNHIELIDHLAERGPDIDLAILHNISMRIAVPEAMEAIGEVPWNAVLTSCIHDVPERTFAADWRIVDPILNDRRYPADPRSRTQLHLFKLYGCVTSDQAAERPPLDHLDLLQRHGVASSMLGRLPELVTPRGILLIDGLAAGDWLEYGRLAERVALLGRGQAHLFGATAELERQTELALLDRLGKLAFHRESLAEVIAQARTAGLISLRGLNRAWVEGVELTLRSGHKHVIQPAEWRQLSGGLTLLSDAEVQPPPEFRSPEERYQAFREFLYGSHGRRVGDRRGSP